MIIGEINTQCERERERENKKSKMMMMIIFFVPQKENSSLFKFVDL